MDGETIRTIATVSGAVLAGFGGAGIAGWFNRKNTKTTIEAVRVQAELDRNQEHMQWLRDRKVKCYADFLGQTDALGRALDTIHTNDNTKIRQLEEITVISSEELLILAPRNIYDAAIKVMHAVSAVEQASKPNTESGTRNANYAVAHRNFIDRYVALERLIRNDLGVEAHIEELA